MNVRECDNSEIHINSNFLLSICLLLIFWSVTQNDLTS